MRILVKRAQQATGMVEYGLMLGAVAVLIVAGLSSLSSAQAGYFSTLGPSVAPPQAATTGHPSHTTSFAAAYTACPTTLVAPAQFTCTATVTDTSATSQSGAPGLTPPSPPTGAITWSITGRPTQQTCSLIRLTAGTSQCALPTQVLGAGSFTITAKYVPLNSDFLASTGPQLTVTVLVPTPTPAPDDNPHGPPCFAPGAAVAAAHAGLPCVV